MRWKKLPLHNGVTYWRASAPCANGTLEFWIGCWGHVTDLWCEQIRGWRLVRDPTEAGARSLKLKAAAWAKALRNCVLRLGTQDGHKYRDVPGTAFRAAKEKVEGKSR